MKAILMAAGKGTRISNEIGCTCKCLLDIGDISLIKNTVSMLHKNKVEVHIVLGYQPHLIREELAEFPVTYHYNPFFHVTNSIASLWFAREALQGDDIIIGNADVYWDNDIYNILLEDTEQNVMLADSSRNQKWKGDYFFMHQDGRLLDHGKELDQTKITAEYVGLGKVRSEFLPQFRERLDQLINNQESQLWWENVLYSYIGEQDIYVCDIAGNFWMEIDYIDDYYKIVGYRKTHALTV